METTPVTRALEKMEVPYRLFRHPGPVASLEQAARERGQSPEQVVRSIVFRLGEGEFVMVMVAGPLRISWPALRRHLGLSRLTMATEEEVLSATGYPLGAVSPFGLPAPMRIMVDTSVLEQNEISLGSGEKYAAVLMTSTELLKALGDVEVGEFTSPAE